MSGACLTVIALDGDGFVVECMPETLTRTTLGQAGPGTLVNLERSLRWGDRLGGHLVLGHVDGVGEVLGVRQAGIAWEVRVSLPGALRGAVAAKGSIAIDGISLTVMRVDDESVRSGHHPAHPEGDDLCGPCKAGMRGQSGGGRAGPLRAAVLQALCGRRLAAGLGAEPVAGTV